MFNIKNYPMLYTVRARIEIGKLAGHSMQEFFDELSKGNEEKSTNLMIDAVEILHNCYLRAKAVEDGKEYEYVTLNRDDFLDLTIKDWGDIETAIVEQIQKDSGIEVEAEAKKKEEKAN